MHTTCYGQQCCDMLRSNVAIIWPNLANAGPTILGYVLWKCLPLFPQGLMLKNCAGFGGFCGIVCAIVQVWANCAVPRPLYSVRRPVYFLEVGSSYHVQSFSFSNMLIALDCFFRIPFLKYRMAGWMTRWANIMNEMYIYILSELKCVLIQNDYVSVN